MKKLICMTAIIAVLAIVLCACGQAAKPLSEVYEQLKTDYNLTEMMDFDSADAFDRYGIAAKDIKEFAGGVNKGGVDQELIIMIQATDSDAADRVKGAYDTYIEQKMKENKNYNPEQYAILEKACVGIDKGTYVSVFISKDAEAMKADYKKAIGA